MAESQKQKGHTPSGEVPFFARHGPLLTVAIASLLGCIILGAQVGRLKSEIYAATSRTSDMLSLIERLKETSPNTDIANSLHEILELSGQEGYSQPPHLLDRYASVFAVALLFTFGVGVPVMLAYQIRRLDPSAPLVDRIAYQIDVWFSSNQWSKLFALLFLSAILILLGGTLYYLVDIQGMTIAGAMWKCWTFIADPGSHADEADIHTRLVAFFLTLGGMMVFALMIGLVAEGISVKVDSLRKGKSAVIEVGHTLILGWSDKIYPLIQQLAVANESESGGVIVVLAERDKEAMETDIHAANCDLRGTQVVCRNGSPTQISDLKKVAAASARSIIVLAQGSDPDRADAQTVRIVLALERGVSQLAGHIVAEVCDIDNEELVKLVAHENVETVVSHDMIGRLFICCARQPGLARVVESLFGFEGSEFYLSAWPSLAGKTFGEILYAFPDAVPIGVRKLTNRRRKQAPRSPSASIDEGSPPRRSSIGKPVIRHNANAYEKKQSKIQTTGLLSPPHQHASGTSTPNDLSFPESEEDMYEWDMLLNPPDYLVLGEKDEILVLAEDNDSYQPVETAIVSPRVAETPLFPSPLRKPEKILVCGWRRDLDDMILEMDKMSAPGSELSILCPIPIEERIEKLRTGGLDTDALNNLHLVHYFGNPSIRSHLESLPLEDYQSILILADESLETDMTVADSRSMASLLLIRDIQAKRINNAGGLHNLKSFSRKYSQPIVTPPDSATTVISSPSQFKSKSHNSHQGDFFKRLENLTSHCVVISEILDSRTKNLISLTHASDYVLSNDMVSRILAMVSEKREIKQVIDELMSAEGNEIYVRDLSCFASEGDCFSFWEMSARVRRRHEVLIGYREAGCFEPLLNPPDKDKRRIWSAEDALICVAQEQ